MSGRADLMRYQRDKFAARLIQLVQLGISARQLLHFFGQLARALGHLFAQTGVQPLNFGQAALAVGHVAQDQRQAQRRVSFASQVGHGQFHVDVVLGGIASGQLIAANGAGPAYLVHQPAQRHLGSFAAAQQPSERLPQDMCSRIAEHLLGSLVPGFDPPGRIQTQDGISRGSCDGGQSLLAGAGQLLGPLFIIQPAINIGEHQERHRRGNGGIEEDVEVEIIAGAIGVVDPASWPNFVQDRRQTDGDGQRPTQTRDALAHLESRLTVHSACFLCLGLQVCQPTPVRAALSLESPPAAARPASKSRRHGALFR